MKVYSRAIAHPREYVHYWAWQEIMTGLEHISEQEPGRISTVLAQMAESFENSFFQNLMVFWICQKLKVIGLLKKNASALWKMLHLQFKFWLSSGETKLNSTEHYVSCYCWISFCALCFISVNLSIADTMVSSLNVTFNYVYMLNGHWPFGTIYCKVCSFISIISVCGSVFTLVAISTDRWDPKS